MYSGASRTGPQLAEFAKTVARPEMLNLLVVTRTDVKDFRRCNYIAAAMPARADVRVTNRSSFSQCDRERCDRKGSSVARRWSQFDSAQNTALFAEKTSAIFGEIPISRSIGFAIENISLPEFNDGPERNV